MMYLPVREHIPFEQGLRPNEILSRGQTHPSQRAYSIRTRIKTLLRQAEICRCCQRAYSIRTRIKTQAYFPDQGVLPVREHIPLEQGLRRFRFSHDLTCFIGQRAYSIRTRIKTESYTI